MTNPNNLVVIKTNKRTKQKAHVPFNQAFTTLRHHLNVNNGSEYTRLRNQLLDGLTLETDNFTYQLKEF